MQSLPYVTGDYTYEKLLLIHHLSSQDNVFEIVTTPHIRNVMRQNAEYPAYSQPNTHNNFDMAQETSNNFNFQSGPIGMPQAQNISRTPMQANLGHPAQEHLKTVPQVDMPEQGPDDITSGFDNYNESALLQTGPGPAFDSTNEHTFPPLAHSTPIQTSNSDKTVIFNLTPGH